MNGESSSADEQMAEPNSSERSVFFADGHEEIPDATDDVSRRLRGLLSNSGSDDDGDDEFGGSNDNSGDDDGPDVASFGGDVEMGTIPSGSSTLQRASLVRRKSGNRTSIVTDLSTGKVGARAQSAQLRSSNSRQARSARQRFLQNLKNLFSFNEDEEDQDNPLTSKMEVKNGQYLVSSRNVWHTNDESEAAMNADKQYCLQAVPPPDQRPKLLRWLGIGSSRPMIYEKTGVDTSCSFCGVHPNQIVINFLHWQFRQNFATVIFTAVTLWFFLTILFGLFIWKAGLSNPQCIGGLNEEFSHFIDAFILSWTTFSTVGYGKIYTGAGVTVTNSTSREEIRGNIRDCIVINGIVSIEVFVGLLFASMCSAIMFVKVSRIQSYAQVDFSDKICIRYGSGVKVESEGDCHDSDNGEHSSECESDKLPCPTLEFRVLNRMHNINGGEIIDATVNVVAAVDAAQACAAMGGASNRRRRGKKGKKGVRRSKTSSMRRLVFGQGPGPLDLVPSNSDASEPFSRLARNGVKLVEVGPRQQSFEEDPTGLLVPKVMLSKLDCESHEHPFFKRAFMVRHRLDEHSPLLKPRARQMVAQNDGFWPKELNSAECVRSSIQFDWLLVSMSGTSNADANSVYAHKAFDFVDVRVGYRFVNMLYRDSADESLKVDESLLNDIMQQAGGGGEELDTGNSEKPRGDMLFL